jgi:CRISPR/Cas system-associated endonuclease Cas1
MSCCAVPSTLRWTPPIPCSIWREPLSRASSRNQIQILQRAGRERADAPLSDAVAQLKGYLQQLRAAHDLDAIRGIEGYAARVYFEAMDTLIVAQREAFRMHTRTRRPPRDRFNALLSFVYSVLTNDYVSALEGVGLDPQVGYLHALRPGRPALALDLMEELRPALADRFALSLVNLQQLTPDHFEERPGGAVLLNEQGRRAKLLVAYQKTQTGTGATSRAAGANPVGISAPHPSAPAGALPTRRHPRVPAVPYPITAHRAATHLDNWNRPVWGMNESGGNRCG